MTYHNKGQMISFLIILIVGIFAVMVASFLLISGRGIFDDLMGRHGPGDDNMIENGAENNNEITFDLNDVDIKDFECSLMDLTAQTNLLLDVTFENDGVAGTVDYRFLDEAGNLILSDGGSEQVEDEIIIQTSDTVLEIDDIHLIDDDIYVDKNKFEGPEPYEPELNLEIVLARDGDSRSYDLDIHLCECTCLSAVDGEDCYDEDLDMKYRSEAENKPLCTEFGTF